MNAAEQSLYERIARFEIDEPGAQLTFVDRLARENGWDTAYAGRVVAEYMRFVFLAFVAGHTVTPSEQVDAAWHLHLTYTRSYWERFCREVLGRPLHHNPTQGGDEEQAKYVALYEQTLASYETYFGHAPPRDIWSDAATRFGEDLQRVTVNKARYWIIPKPSWCARRNPPSAKAHNSVVIAGFMFTAPVLAAGANPLDWRGPEFLAFYAVLMAMAFACAIAARMLLRPRGGTDTKPKPLHPYEAACLAGGKKRAIDAAVVGMVQSGALRLEETKKKVLGVFNASESMLHQGTPPALQAPEIERAIYEGAKVPVPNARMFYTAAGSAAEEIESRLMERGLIHTGAIGLPQMIAGMIMASPLLIGGPKLLVGMERGRPVAFLFVACAVTMALAIVMLVVRSRRTTQGKALLNEYTAKYEARRGDLTTDPAALGAAEMSMLVGLWGVSLLSVGPLAPLYRAMPRESGGGGCGGSGCGGGGGGGCGGGGCGGGGCGGCGGG